jgi:ClpP class serine protease
MGRPIFSARQLPIRQTWLEASRLRLLKRLERKRASMAIAWVHRQETISFLGVLLMCYTDVHDSEEVLRAIRLCDPDCPVDLIIHTPSGLVPAAAQMAHALHPYCGKVTVFVPHYTMSGGT